MKTRKPNLHSQIMNLKARPNNNDPTAVRYAHIEGHSQARHDAAEVVAGATADVPALVAVVREAYQAGQSWEAVVDAVLRETGLL